MSDWKEENKAVYVEIIETQTTSINTDYQPCSQYSKKDFLQCSKASLRRILEENLSCYCYSFKEFLSENEVNLPECTSLKSVAKVTLNLEKVYLKN